LLVLRLPKVDSEAVHSSSREQSIHDNRTLTGSRRGDILKPRTHGPL
jgi:hypothetical protein